MLTDDEDDDVAAVAAAAEEEEEDERSISSLDKASFTMRNSRTMLEVFMFLHRSNVHHGNVSSEDIEAEET